MNFYLNMVRKYSNIRTFKPEDGTGAGAGAGEGVTSAADGGAGDGAGDGASGDENANKADPGKTKQNDAGKGKETAQKAAEELTIDEIKALLEAEKAEKAELLRESMSRKEKLKQFDGVDPEKYRTLVEKERADELASAEAKGEFDRVKAMMAEAHATEKAALEAQIEELRGQVSTQARAVDELSIGNAFGNSSYIKDNLVLTPSKTRVLYGDHFEAVDGVIVAYDKPKGASDRTQLVDAAGKPLSFDAALEKIVSNDPEKKSVLRWKAKNGSGSNTDTNGDKGGKPDAQKQPELFGASRIMAGLASL